MTTHIAIVLGGAKCWRSDLDATHNLLARTSMTLTYYTVNDQIYNHPGDVIACTLHPEKLDYWLDKRTVAGHPPPRECWHPPRLQDRGGTSSLFAFFVARHHGHERIIFCGVPMDDSKNAFEDVNGIGIYTRHRRHWTKQKHFYEIKQYARSASGWTAELLGVPDEQFLGI